MIQYATKSDLANIARCHVQAFPKSVTSLLGPEVVASMLEWYISAPNKFLFFTEENGMVTGYCGGYVADGTDSFGSSSGLAQFGFRSAAGAFARKPWLLLHPSIRKKYKFILLNIGRKLGLLKKPPPSIQLKKPVPDKMMAGLVVIGVAPAYQRTGLGSKLQEEFERKARSMHAQLISLSVRTNNQQAIRSYERNGFSILRTEGPSYIMTKAL